MLFRILLLSCLGLCAFLPRVRASHPAVQDKELLRIFAAIGTADGYAYSLTIRSRLMDGSAAGQGGDSAVTLSGRQYTSRQGTVIYSSNGSEESLLCDKGIFKMDAAGRSVRYHLFRDSTELQAYLSGYPADGGAAVMDSLLLRPATVVSRTKTGHLVTYRLSYPKDWMIREATVAYDESTGFLTRMSYTLERSAPAMPAGAGAPGGRPLLRQQITMSDYRKAVPPLVGELLQGLRREGLPFLQRRYPGFALQPL